MMILLSKSSSGRTCQGVLCRSKVKVLHLCIICFRKYTAMFEISILFYLSCTGVMI